MNEIIENQIPLDPEFNDIINKNFWDLIIDQKPIEFEIGKALSDHSHIIGKKEPKKNRF